MDIDDIMKPNKYGTQPIIDLYGFGSIVKQNNHYLLTYYFQESCLYSKDDFYIAVQDMPNVIVSVYSDKAELNRMVGEVRYLKQATAEERLIAQAIDGNNIEYYINIDGVYRRTEEPHRILPNGTGWVLYRGLEHPATFYIDDILYRLDLQGELP